MRHFWLALAALLISGSPAAAGVIFNLSGAQVPAADVGDYAKIHKVAVLSAIGSTFGLQVVHLMSPTDGEMDIADWHLDDRVNASLRRYLGGRFSFVDVPYDRAKLATIYPNFMGNSEMRRFVEALPGQDVDAFIVVRGVHPFKVVSGYAQDQTVLWVDYIVEVIDAHSHEMIAKAIAHLQFSGFAIRRIGDDFAFDDSFNISPANKDKLHAMSLATLDDTLLECVRALQFGVPLPPMRDAFDVTLPSPSPPPPVKTLVIASALCDRLDIYEDGDLFAATTRTAVSMPGWGVDGEVEADIRRALGTGYDIKDLALDRAALGQARLVFANGGAHVTGLPAAGDVDAYLLAIKLGSDEEWKNAIRIWRYGNIFGTFGYVAASYALVLVDPRTGEVLAGQVGIRDLGETGGFAATRMSGDWPEQPLTPDAAGDIRDKLKAMFAKSIPETLGKLGLKPN